MRRHPDIVARALLSGYDAYVGTYTKDGQPEKTFVLARDGSRLMFQIPRGVSRFEIFPESPGQFFAKWSEFFLTFVNDDKERVTHVSIRNEGEGEKWTKSP